MNATWVVRCKCRIVCGSAPFDVCRLIIRRSRPIAADINCMERSVVGRIRLTVRGKCEIKERVALLPKCFNIYDKYQLSLIGPRDRAAL